MQANADRITAHSGPSRSGPPPSSRAAPARRGRTKGRKTGSDAGLSKYLPDIPATSGERASQIDVCAPSSGVMVAMPGAADREKLRIDNSGVQAVGSNARPYEIPGKGVGKRHIGKLRERVGVPGSRMPVLPAGCPSRSRPRPHVRSMRR